MTQKYKILIPIQWNVAIRDVALLLWYIPIYYRVL